MKSKSHKFIVLFLVFLFLCQEISLARLDILRPVEASKKYTIENDLGTFYSLRPRAVEEREEGALTQAERARLIGLLKKRFARGDISTILLKGGDIGGLDQFVKRDMIRRLRELGFIVYEGSIRKFKVRDILKRWGPTGMQSMLKKMMVNPKFSQQAPDMFTEVQEIIRELDVDRFSQWLKAAERTDPQDEGLRNLRYWLAVMSEPVQQLVLVRCIPREIVLERLKRWFGTEALENEGQFTQEDDHEMNFVKKAVAGATNSLRAHRGSLRSIGSSELLKKRWLYRRNAALAALYGFGDDMIFIAQNMIHCPSADTPEVPELSIEIETLSGGDLILFSRKILGIEPIGQPAPNLRPLYSQRYVLRPQAVGERDEGQGARDKGQGEDGEEMMLVSPEVYEIMQLVEADLDEYLKDPKLGVMSVSEMVRAYAGNQPKRKKALKIALAGSIRDLFKSRKFIPENGDEDADIWALPREALGRFARRNEITGIILEGLRRGKLIILFVCTSNAGRSVWAQLITDDFVKKQGLGNTVTVMSGPARRLGKLSKEELGGRQKMWDYVREAAIAKGVDEGVLKRPSAGLLTKKMIDGASVVFVAERDNIGDIQKVSSASAKTFLLTELLPAADQMYGENIPDDLYIVDSITGILERGLFPLLISGPMAGPAMEDMPHTGLLEPLASI